MRFRASHLENIDTPIISFSPDPTDALMPLSNLLAFIHIDILPTPHDFPDLLDAHERERKIMTR